MIVHNAAAVAMVLLALAAAQGRGHDMTGDMTGTMGQGSGAAQTSQPRVMDQHGDVATQDAVVDAMASFSDSRCWTLTAEMTLIPALSRSTTSSYRF